MSFNSLRYNCIFQICIHVSEVNHLCEAQIQALVLTLETGLSTERMSSKNEVLNVLKEQRTSKCVQFVDIIHIWKKTSLWRDEHARGSQFAYPNLALHENVLNGKRGERISAQKKRIISLKS